MINEEAQRIIDGYIVGANYTNEDYVDCVNVEALQVASVALEKQVPQKPIYEGDDEQDHVLCPCCKEIVGVVDDYYGENGLNIFCFHCGQALDWSNKK